MQTSIIKTVPQITIFPLLGPALTPKLPPPLDTKRSPDGICANHCLLVLKLAVSEYLIEVQIVDCQESFDGAVVEGGGGGSLKLYSGSERILERKVLSWGRNGCKNHSLNGEEMASHPFRTSIEEKQLAGGVLLIDPLVSLDYVENDFSRIDHSVDDSKSFSLLGV